MSNKVFRCGPAMLNLFSISYRRGFNLCISKNGWVFNWYCYLWDKQKFERHSTFGDTLDYTVKALQFYWWRIQMDFMVANEDEMWERLQSGR